MAGLGTSVLGVSSAPFLPSRSLHRRSLKPSQKTIVLGIDGMDPKLVRRFVAEGIMPNFKAAMERGYFGELRTTMPPQTPVAWASFINGCNPGGTGIFDFVHRDPGTFSPFLSTARTFSSHDSFSVGSWKIPLKSGRVDNMRRGRAFWSVLQDHGIPTSIFQIPSNFPVIDESDGTLRAISGAGTPDVLGGYGTFTYYSELAVPGADELEGGRVIRIRPVNHEVKTILRGPKNSFREGDPESEIDLVINRDPHNPVLKIAVGDQQIILKQGEWSEWVPLKFGLVPMFASVAGMVRFFAKEVHPRIKIYVSPINIDPMDPVLPICTPSAHSRELAEVVGRFYTQGFPADSKSLSSGVLSDEEYFSQAKIVIEENMRALAYQLDNFQEGCLFFYFSSIDQNCHMLWRCMEPSHPLYDPNASPELKNAVRWFFRRIDDALGMTLAKVDSNTTFIALSDHGFTTFERELHLTTWLAKEGFTRVDGEFGARSSDFFKGVNWQDTKAYTIGLNGIYLNLAGREKNGSLPPSQAQQVKEQIASKLKSLTDPKNGASVISEVYDGAKIYSGAYTEYAPDLVVGYRSGYRISDTAAFGKFPDAVIADRTDKWAADHCIDAAAVPGMLLTNRPCIHPAPGLWDMAPTILKSFGIDVPAEMEGKPVLAT